MTKQELARKRNQFKFYVSGMFRNVDRNVMTLEEIGMWEDMMTMRKLLEANFDNNSRLLGLNVPPKCWCRKPAKYTPVSYPDGHKGLVCGKHINYEE